MNSRHSFKLVCDSCGKPIGGSLVCDYYMPLSNNSEVVRRIEVKHEDLLFRVLCDKCLNKELEEGNGEI